MPNEVEKKAEEKKLTKYQRRVESRKLARSIEQKRTRASKKEVTPSKKEKEGKHAILRIQ